MLIRSMVGTLAAIVLLTGACAEPESGDSISGDSTTLLLDTRARGTLDRIGDDSLLHTVRITALFPEPDGEAIPVLFADTGRDVSAGLAIIDARSDAPQLLWPDSVTRVWWSGDHALTFTTETGRGAYLVVDVHAAAVDSLAIASPPDEAPPDSTESVSLGRAQRYIDSLQAQPTGVAEPGTLQYTVTRWIPDPTRTFAAFHATARDSTGREVNPSWYITDLGTGAIERVDQVVGAAEELPANGGGWTNDHRFLFAKGATVHEVRIGRGPRASPTTAWSTWAQRLSSVVMHHRPDGRDGFTPSRKVRAPWAGRQVTPGHALWA